MSATILISYRDGEKRDEDYEELLEEFKRKLRSPIILEIDLYNIRRQVQSIKREIPGYLRHDLIMIEEKLNSIERVVGRDQIHIYP